MVENIGHCYNLRYGLFVMAAKHHFVPQFYLRNFAIAGKPGQIYVYERNKKPAQVSIKNVAAKKDYYSIKSKNIDLPFPRDKVERIFSVGETGAAPIIKHFLTANSVELHPEDREILAIFIAGLSNRTPWFRRNLKDSHISLLKHMLKFAASDKRILASELKKAGVEVESDEELESLMESFQNPDEHFRIGFRGGGSEDYFLRTALELADNLVPVIYGKELHILESSSCRVFITSDNPIVLLPPKGHHPADGLGFLDASILLPISPKRALLLRNRKAVSEVIQIGREKVDFYNSYVNWFALNEVYSNIMSHDIEKAFNETPESGSLRGE